MHVLFPFSNLLANSFNCNCHLAWLGKWLRKKRIVSGNPRCLKPFFLKDIPIQDVDVQDFTCDGKKIQFDLALVVMLAPLREGPSLPSSAASQTFWFSDEKGSHLNLEIIVLYQYFIFILDFQCLNFYNQQLNIRINLL